MSQSTNMISWDRYPAELRLMILEALLQDGCSLAGFAAVSREWQTVIERHSFSRIKLTSSRLADFGSILHRNRRLVRYIWLCLELEEYDCNQCAPPMSGGMSYADSTLVTTAFQDLFTTLSAWEPDGNLQLDISIHSPSDSKHWFKYLTFEPDVASDMCGRDHVAEQLMLVRTSDHNHGWNASSQRSIPPYGAIDKIFDEIIGEPLFDPDEERHPWWQRLEFVPGGQFDTKEEQDQWWQQQPLFERFYTKEEQDQWWQQLPLVPSVTSVLLRQQTRRRWIPLRLACMFARLPGLQEIHYEPWREWDGEVWQERRDESYPDLFESLASDSLRRLVLFENFNHAYIVRDLYCDPIRIPSSDVSRAVAKASLDLEHLSASFIVDASAFFSARERSWNWPNLTWLALTSRLLAPEERMKKLDGMLRSAAAAAMKMPNLETMEIWNGDKGLAMLFRYRAERDRPAVITVRGTHLLTLRPRVIKAWNSVALRHRGQEALVIKEVLDAGICIKSHADAIHHLNFSRPVIRPVSLRQIQMEHMIREGVQS